MLESLRITADHIEFSDETSFDQPQQRSLYGLTGKDGTSILILKNICVKDPAKGTLFTQMPNVEFTNVKVHGECKCDLVENLACAKGDFEMEHTGFLQSLSCNDLKKLLINSTLCQVRY